MVYANEDMQDINIETTNEPLNISDEENLIHDTPASLDPEAKQSPCTNTHEVLNNCKIQNRQKVKYNISSIFFCNTYHQS